MENNNNKTSYNGEYRIVRNNKSQTIKGVGTSKVTRDKFSENTTTYMTRSNNDKKQGK